MTLLFNYHDYPISNILQVLYHVGKILFVLPLELVKSLTPVYYS